MRRVVFEGNSRSELFSGERLSLRVMVVDDMGNDVGSEDTTLLVSVSRVRQSLARPTESVYATPHFLSALVAADGLEALEESEGHFSIECPTDGGCVSAEAAVSDPPRLLRLRPKPFSNEFGCTAYLHFSEELHQQGTQVSVTVTVVDASDAALPLQLGPLWLSGRAGDRRDRLEERAAWSRRLRHIQDSQLSVLLVEEQGQSSTIAGSLWDAGLVLGSYLVHLWRNSPDALFATAASGSSTVAALELGCGTGCAGLMLADAIRRSESEGGGRHRMCLTDGNDTAVALARLNADVNALSSGVASCAKLCWGSMHPVAELIAGAALTDTDGVGLLFAADVVYDEAKFQSLVETMHRAACGGPAGTGTCNGTDRPPAVVILAYRLRMGPDKAAHFWHLVSERFEVQPPVPSTVVADALLAYGFKCGSQHGVSIYHLTPLEGRPQRTSCTYCVRVLQKRVST